MCPRQYVSGARGFMELSLFTKVLREIENRDVTAIVPFFRGEPLLHPNFLEIMALLKEKTSAEIQIATNALLLDEGSSKKLIEMGLDFISFSLDAVNKETYEKIRTGGDFDLAINNICTFRNLGKTISGSKTEIQVSATENEYNRNEIQTFIDYWKRRVDRVRIYPEHSRNGRFGELARPTGREESVSMGPCRKLFTEMVIYCDGNAALCNHDWDEALHDPLGTVMDQTISGIWNGESYRQMRERHLEDQIEGILPCEFCDHRVSMNEQTAAVGRLIQDTPRRKAE